MKPQERQIGAFKYRMEPLGALTGRQVLLRILRPFAAFLAGAAGAGGRLDAKSLLEEGDPELAKQVSPELAAKLAAGIGPALASLSEADFEFCCDTFAEKTTVFLPDGKKLRPWPLDRDRFDEHFAGRYLDMIAWLKWAIELNGFFGGALERMAKSEAEGSSSTSRATSTGGPGDCSAATD